MWLLAGRLYRTVKYLKMNFCTFNFNRILSKGVDVVSKKCLKEQVLLRDLTRNKHSVTAVPNSKVKKVQRYGQPTPETHPHLLKPGELLPGFVPKEFAERRSRLINSVWKTNNKSCHVVLIPSASVQYMTDKIPYVFRQNSDFRYLTGCLEPDSALLLFVVPDGSSDSILFVREKNEHSELWEGPRTGVDLAPQFFGVNDSRPISSLSSDLYQIKKSMGTFTFWYDYFNPVSNLVHESVKTFLTESGMKLQELVSVKSKIHELRLLKSIAEQELLKSSADLASRGIEKAMTFSKPGATEHQLYATVDHFCRMNGAEILAYPPVVAAGNNANVIHYIENTQAIKDGDLILMDAGCELHGYSSDITRTWPVNGRFTEAQRVLYEIVLRTQLDLIAQIRPKEVTLNQLFENMCILLGKNLKEAHVLTKTAENLKLDVIGYKLCPHHVGHYLGMDVHDTGTITRDIGLNEGMLITIEPGLYINYGCAITKPEFHGVGIRIEDDVMITSKGAEVISNAVKHPDEVELLCQSSSV